MAHIQSFDHIGVTVADLDAAIEFFTGLGLELEGRAFVEGEFIDTVCGIPGSHTEVAMLRPPGGGTALELARFLHPDHVAGSPEAMANELGLRNVCYVVEDLDAALAYVAEQGFGLVGGVGEWQQTYRMAYVRGPEGIIVSLTEEI